MSIAPPSDIIMDVAQAADPLKLQAATDKLARAAAAGGAGGAGAPTFEAALKASGGGFEPSISFSALPSAFGINGKRPAVDARHASVDQKFEAMVLQSFVENILPKNTELFGDAASADMGRSLLAEQIAKQLAKSGRIGIAQSLERGAANTPTAATAPLADAPART